MPCNLVEVHQHFGGIYFLNFQGQRVSHARNQQEVDSKQSCLAFLSVGSDCLQQLIFLFVRLLS
jgi:hypothetical protein